MVLEGPAVVALVMEQQGPRILAAAAVPEVLVALEDRVSLLSAISSKGDRHGALRSA
jgi:hypothetical protein